MFVWVLNTDFIFGTQWSKISRAYVPRTWACVPKWDAVSTLKYALGSVYVNMSVFTNKVQSGTQPNTHHGCPAEEGQQRPSRTRQNLTEPAAPLADRAELITYVGELGGATMHDLPIT